MTLSTMRISRAIYRLLIGCFFFYVGAEMLFEKYDAFKSDANTSIFGIVFTTFWIILYAIYEFHMSFNDFVKNHIRNKILYWSTSVTPLFFMIYGFYDFGSSFSSLEISHVFALLLLVGLVALHVFDFFFYRRPKKKQLIEIEDVLDF